MPKQPLLNQQRSRLLVALFVLLASVYMITYSARIESSDTRRFVDVVSSFADYGDFYLDLSNWQFPPTVFDARLKYPLQSGDVEPLQVILAAPLYLLAKITPGIGLVQTIYLFNIIVCAVAGCVLFLYALALGYRERTAVLAALAFGIGTAIFPYSKTFFREPLALLMLLICGLLIERLRVRNYRSLPLLIAVVVALAALFLAKASMLLALPALFVIGIPNLTNIQSQRRAQFRRVLIVSGLLVILALGIFVLLSASSGFGSRYNFLRVFNGDLLDFFPVALQAYLLSVGGSIWGTSPIVLLALPGIVILLRRRMGRYPLALLLLIAAFAGGYAAANDRHWFGGLSWPPRFLIPLLPYLILGALPIFERVQTSLRWALVGAALMIYSVWVQLSGVTLDWLAYPSLLPPEAHGLLEWGAGLNELRYLRWVLIPQQWQAIPLDIAWAVIHAQGIMAAFAALAAGAGVWIIRGLRSKALRRTVLILPVLLILIIGVGEHILYANDPHYLATDDTLYAMLPILEAETNPSDVILLSSPRYEPFFMASGKLFHAGRVVTLEMQPGEQPSPEQQPLVRSDNPTVLLKTGTIQLIYNLAATRDRLWLLVDGGPDLPWSVRPVERFMSAHYYPIRTIQTGTITRLIEYSTINAPDMFAYREPDHPTDLAFNHIRLVGYDLPNGTAYHPGDVLALTTAWKTDAALTENATIGLYLRDANGNAVAQVDAQPGAGFYPTNQWQAGIPIWDNRAIRLPSDLSAGTYQLWVKLYDFNADGSVHDLPVTSGAKMDDSIGILPVQIQVS